MTRKCPSARRPSIVALALAAAALGPTACGGAAGGARSAKLAYGVVKETAPLGSYLRNDGDTDNDDPHASFPGQDHQSLLATYGGRPAPAATARAIAAVVKRYYAVSAAGEGAHACALLSTGARAGVAVQQPGSANCTSAIATLLAQQHAHLVTEEPASMTVIGAYAKGDLGLAVLGFRRAPESDVVLEREGGVWRIASPLDNLVP